MTKIIFIIGFSTKPEEYDNQPRPQFCWTRQDGKMIGIWGMEWGEILMKALIKFSPEYEGEIWKPEVGADRIYSAQLSERLVSRKFPAIDIRYTGLIRHFNRVSSESIIAQVKLKDNSETIFMLPVTRKPSWIDDVINSIGQARIIHYNFLNSSLMLPQLLRTCNPLQILRHELLNRGKAHRLRKIRNLLTMNDNPQALCQLHKRYPQMKIFNFMWGYDLEYWQPIAGKNVARKDLGILDDRFMVLLSQRLSPEYQVDKVIIALSKIRTQRNFSCYITGHGIKDYENYLQDVVLRHQMQGNVHFMGFIDDETLRRYFEAADLFINLPVNSAGSASALKATMCGVPVLLIPTGALYEFLKNQSAGEFVDPTDYESWEEKIQQIIEGEIQVRVPSRQALVDHFSWEKNIKDIKCAIEEAK